MDKKVNLLIIGTQKAGTTSLYEYIKQHNDIYFSDIKEVTYFVQDELYSKGEEYYHSFFQSHNNEQVSASAYVHMLPCQKCPERVKVYNPDMKFIVMLRDPVERAYSAYKYAIKNGWEDEKNSFEDTIELEKERIKKEQYDLTYFYNGLYTKHIVHWQKYFPEKNFLIIQDTELKNNSKEVLKKVFSFLEIEDLSESIDTSKEFNKAGVVRSKELQSFLLSKNSKLKKIIAFFLPRKLKVLIMSYVMPKIFEFNQVDKMNTVIHKDLEKKIRKIFDETIR